MPHQTNHVTEYPEHYPDERPKAPRPQSQLENILDRLNNLRSYAARVRSSVVDINEKLAGSTPTQDESSSNQTGHAPGLLGELQATIDYLEETVADLDHEVTSLGAKV